MDKLMVSNSVAHRSAPAILNSESEIKITSRVMSALAHPARLQILCLLQGREMAVVELTGKLDGHTQSSVSQHLAALRNADVVKTRKAGTRIMYRINDSRLHSIMKMITLVFCTSPWRKSADDAVVRLGGAMRPEWSY